MGKENLCKNEVGRFSSATPNRGFIIDHLVLGLSSKPRRSVKLVKKKTKKTIRAERKEHKTTKQHQD